MFSIKQLFCFFSSWYTFWKTYFLGEAYPEAIKINDCILQITYWYHGKKYITFVPYNKKLLVKMRNSSTYKVSGGNKSLLEVQPGVVPLVSPYQLGVDAIEVENHFTHKVIRVEGTDKIVYV
jgi:hypothetical protein